MKLPSEFEARTLEWMGEETYRALEAALQTEPPVSIRVNRTKWSGEVTGEPVLWASAGVYLSQRPTFTFDPLFHAGCYYVQEASSMFVEQVLRTYITGPVVMLDLCAAPGGKSTHVRSVLPVGSLLVANEVMRNRSQVLAENLIKWGNVEVVVTNNDPADFTSLTEVFDVVLADVPCSGEGMFRKDPVAVSEWSPENVEICWQRQRRIISDIWPCLKPGGILIYSTCTYNTKEDEENVRWLRDEFGAEALHLDISDGWKITGNLLPGEDFPVYRFFPHKTEGEGFFLAVLRKPGQSAGGGWAAPAKPRGRGAKAPELAKGQLSVVRGWLASPDEYEFILNGNHVSAFPKNRLEELSALRLPLRIVQAGADIAEQKGKDWMPAHGLAMSRVLNQDAFAREEISHEQAVAYLRKEAVVLPGTAPRGIVLLTYKQVPLGFVKNIGNRANNLYPQEWRIRSGYMPEEVSELSQL